MLVKRFNSYLLNILYYFKPFLKSRRTYVAISLLSIILVLYYYYEFEEMEFNSTPAFTPDPYELIILENQSLGNGVPVQRKIAFLFLIQSSLPLAPFWIKFFRNYEHLSSIYINSNPDFAFHLPHPFLRDHHFTLDTRSGGFSVVDAEFLLLSSALKDRGNDRFILLSESCIPLYNFEYFYNYLMDSPLSYVNIIDNNLESNFDRYSHVFMPEIPQKSWVKGEQWFEMTYEAVIRVTTDKLYFPKFKQYCPSAISPGCVPFEHCFQINLVNNAGYLLANRSLTWTNWKECPTCPRPKTYNVVDEYLLDSIRSDKCEWNGKKNHPCHLVAREFTPYALPSLLHYSYLLGF